MLARQPFRVNWSGADSRNCCGSKWLLRALRPPADALKRGRRHGVCDPTDNLVVAALLRRALGPSSAGTEREVFGRKSACVERSPSPPGPGRRGRAGQNPGPRTSQSVRAARLQDPRRRRRLLPAARGRVGPSILEMFFNLPVLKGGAFSGRLLEQVVNMCK